MNKTVDTLSGTDNLYDENYTPRPDSDVKKTYKYASGNELRTFKDGSADIYFNTSGTYRFFKKADDAFDMVDNINNRNQRLNNYFR